MLPIYHHSESGWGDSKMRLGNDTKRNILNIFWEFISKDGTKISTIIKLTLKRTNKRLITRYDGVLELPVQAIQLLKSNGFDTSEVEL